MINVYLIRHGIAADPGEYKSDRDRPLTDEGKQKTVKVAKRLKELNIHFDLILSSPLIRAQQTAQILLETGLGVQVEEHHALMPGGDMNMWLSWFEEWRERGNNQLALVGHIPDLTNWAEILISGKINDGLILKKAGIIGLNLPQKGSPVGESTLFWLTPPKFLI